MKACELIRIAESANPPDFIEDQFGDVEMAASDGWLVTFFYDVGDLDYIAHFTSPDGVKIDFWNWPESDDRDMLMAWRGIGDGQCTDTQTPPKP